MARTRREDRPGARRGFRSESALFLWQLLRNPSQVSALAPSSRRLARAMAAAVPPRAVTVAELGPGTGRLTRALIKRGLAPGNIHAFEINPVFAARLRLAFPGLRVHERPAQDLARIGPPRLDAVVSGLPLLSMPEAARAAIVAAAFRKLSPGGVFVQFTYGPASPLPEAILRRHGLVYRRSRRIWTNLPPATVYVYARRADGAAR